MLIKNKKYYHNNIKSKIVIKIIKTKDNKKNYT